MYKLKVLWTFSCDDYDKREREREIRVQRLSDTYAQ